MKKRNFTARTVFYDLNEMTGHEFKKTIDWLRNTANLLKKEGHRAFNKRFITKLMK